MINKIKELTEKLRLFGMGAQVEELLAHAEKNGMPTAEVLLSLLTTEYDEKQTRHIANKIKQAKLPWPWTLDTFPFEQQPGINKIQVMGLAQLDFMKRSENIILIGEPGTGKSGIAMGLLRTALNNGYRGRFYNAQDLLDELYSSLADKTTTTLLNRLCNYDLLVIDELGYLTLTTEKVNMFFKLIDMRYRKKPTIVTTNLPFTSWYEIFKDKSLVDAMLDRFKHYCTTIEIVGPSLRKAEEKKQKKPSTKLPKKQDG